MSINESLHIMGNSMLITLVGFIVSKLYSKSNVPFPTTYPQCLSTERVCVTTLSGMVLKLHTVLVSLFNHAWRSGYYILFLFRLMTQR